MAWRRESWRGVEVGIRRKESRGGRVRKKKRKMGALWC